MFGVLLQFFLKRKKKGGGATILYLHYISNFKKTGSVLSDCYSFFHIKWGGGALHIMSPFELVWGTSPFPRDFYTI